MLGLANIMSREEKERGFAAAKNKGLWETGEWVYCLSDTFIKLMFDHHFLLSPGGDVMVLGRVHFDKEHSLRWPTDIHFPKVMIKGDLSFANMQIRGMLDLSRVSVLGPLIFTNMGINDIVVPACYEGITHEDIKISGLILKAVPVLE